MTKYTDIGVETHGHVGLIEIRKPPLNFFDVALINQIADALEEFDNDIEIRASVLAAQGKAFCAGANFGDPAPAGAGGARRKSDPAGEPADQPSLRAGGAHLPQQEADRRRASMAPPSAAASDLRCRPTSASPAPRRASPPTSPSSASIPASA